MIGGIFVGQSLIHTAQINSVITEFNRWQTATQNFQQQYQAIPGDMTNATSFWGSAGGTGADATCAAAGSTTAATCNGNGDGYLSNAQGHFGEIYAYWKQLSNAKIIEGSYSGATLSNVATIGVNVPASKYTGSTAIGWSIWYAPNMGGGVWFTAAVVNYGTGNVFILGSNSGIWVTQGLGIPAKDAWAIDKKVDDGKPGTGNIIVNFSCTTVTGNNTPSPDGTNGAATYMVGSTAPCSMVFLPSF